MRTVVKKRASRGATPRRRRQRKPVSGEGCPLRLAAGTTERLRMALDAADMVIWEWDLSTGVIRYSENVPVIAAGDNVEPYSTVASLLDLVHPDDRSKLEAVLNRTLTQHVPFECEYRVMMQDGAYHWILGKGKTVLIEEGKPVRCLGISQDITTRKQAEIELQRRSHQLAALASKLIMTEHRERRRLADILHEELQQILVGARIQAHTLEVEERGEKRKRLGHLGETLEEVLGLSRSITKDLAPPVLPHKESVLAFQWVTQEMSKRYGLEVALRVEASFSDVDEAMAVLLFSAARELLLNVVKHAGVRKASLCVRRNADRIEVEVFDRGKGFESNSLHIPFDQSGFGLFSIRERAELMGGGLAMDSAPGKGTRAVVSLPISKGEKGGLIRGGPD